MTDINENKRGKKEKDGWSKIIFMYIEIMCFSHFSTSLLKCKCNLIRLADKSMRDYYIFFRDEKEKMDKRVSVIVSKRMLIILTFRDVKMCWCAYGIIQTVSLLNRNFYINK